MKNFLNEIDEIIAIDVKKFFFIYLKIKKLVVFLDFFY